MKLVFTTINGSYCVSDGARSRPETSYRRWSVGFLVIPACSRWVCRQMSIMNATTAAAAAAAAAWAHLALSCPHVTPPHKQRQHIGTLIHHHHHHHSTSTSTSSSSSSSRDVIFTLLRTSCHVVDGTARDLWCHRRLIQASRLQDGCYTSERKPAPKATAHSPTRHRQWFKPQSHARYDYWLLQHRGDTFVSWHSKRLHLFLRLCLLRRHKYSSIAVQFVAVFLFSCHVRPL